MGSTLSIPNKTVMADLKEMRIVLLGKTGYGKSSCGNTILGNNNREKFGTNGSSKSKTSKCEVHRGLRAGTGTQIEIIDTPGFFDTCKTDEELLPEIVKCIALSSPGPHAFIIVLRVERFTEQETATVAKITRSFGEDALKYSAVLFTHGDDLDEGQTIEQFVEQNKALKELVKKCGGGCHVIDNKYWNQGHGYRNNSVQVEKLLNTIDGMVTQNGGGCYTNEMLKAVEEGIQREEEEIRKENSNKKSAFKIRAEAIGRFTKKLLAKCAGLAVGVLVGAFLGIVIPVGVAFIVIGAAAGPPSSTMRTSGAKKGVAAVKGITGGVMAAYVGCYAPVTLAYGAIGGGIFGAQAVEDGDGICEAVKKAATTNWENAKNAVAEAKQFASELEDVHKAIINKGYNEIKNE